MHVFLWETNHTCCTKVFGGYIKQAVARSILFLFFPWCINLCCCGCIAHTAIPHVLALARLLVANKANLNFCWAMFQHLKKKNYAVNEDVVNERYALTRLLTRKPFTWRKTLMGWRPHMVFSYSCRYSLNATGSPVSMISMPIRSKASIDLWIAPCFFS